MASERSNSQIPSDRGSEGRRGSFQQSTVDTQNSGSTGARGETPVPRAPSEQPSVCGNAEAHDAPDGDDENNTSTMTQFPPGNRRDPGPRESIQDIIRKAGLGHNTPLAALDTKLAQAIILFWADADENFVPTRRRTDLVKEAMTSAYWARSARRQPVGNPNDIVYVDSVMRRISILAGIYNEEKYKHNPGPVTPGREPPPILYTPDNYLSTLRELAAENPLYHSPVPLGLELVAAEPDQHHMAYARSTTSAGIVATKVIRDMHEVG